MRKIKHPRTLKLEKNYIPKKQINEELEIYAPADLFVQPAGKHPYRLN